MGNAPRIMVNVPNATASQQNTAAKASAPQRTQPFTAEQLQVAWQNYIDQHPQERALCTTMSYALPQQGDNAEHYVAYAKTFMEENPECRFSKEEPFQLV